VAAGPLLLEPGELAGVRTGEYYRMVTAAFLHAGLLHLAMNMFALASLGTGARVGLGRTRFLALYLLSALGGFDTVLPVAEQTTVGVGASGAIFGWFGRLYVVARKLGGDTRSILTPAGSINLVITFAIPIIDWRAHLGGLVTGPCRGLRMAYRPARTSPHCRPGGGLRRRAAAARRGRRRPQRRARPADRLGSPHCGQRLGRTTRVSVARTD
jgi:membrane associated rhomboid family serine protease